MVEPQNYTQSLISRVAALGSKAGEKTLIVSCAPALKEMIQNVAYLKLHETVEFLEASKTDMSSDDTLTVDPAINAVLIAATTSHTMNSIGRLCRGYQSAGIPVVVISGWPPPMTKQMYAAETTRAGNITVPGMFDLAALYSRGGNKGDFLEFGSFQGYTLQCAYHAFNRINKNNTRRFISFDSFAGIVGTREDESFSDGGYATSETSFRFSNALAGVPDDRVTTIVGPFQSTLDTDVQKTQETLGPIEAAVVHIDCDVEEPAKLALDFVTPYLKQGSLILFDEYDMHQADNTKGERSALRRWLSENPAFEVEHYRSYHSTARSFIVHKKSPSS